MRANANPTGVWECKLHSHIFKISYRVDILISMTPAQRCHHECKRLRHHLPGHGNNWFRNGTIRLDVVDDNINIDAAGNPLGELVMGITHGQVYTINKILMSCANQSQIPRQNVLVLVALYNSTNGAHKQHGLARNTNP
jgi:hypothetical protein